MLPLFAVEIPEFALIVLKIFALIGIAAASGWVLGWLATMAAKLYFAQKIPPWPMWFIRTLGFVAGGMIGYLILFGAGGSGFGGGGWGLGNGGPKDGVVPKKDESVRKDKDKDQGTKEKDKDIPKVTPQETLRIEVLGDPALKRAIKSFDPQRRYRMSAVPDLLTLEEIKERIRGRLQAQPPLRLIEVILYNDSPAPARPQVADLETWIEDLRRKNSTLVYKRSEQQSDAP